MQKLINYLGKLQQSSIAPVISQRMREFEEAGKGDEDKLFSELCFCLMTANFNAERSMKIQQAVQNGFRTFAPDELTEKLKEHGHRFPNMRSSFIVEARKHHGGLRRLLETHSDELALREWFAKNVKGLGYKEASHYLRNIGYKNLAIIDFHIVDLLARYGLVEKTEKKSITPRQYLEIEGILSEIGRKSGLSQAELDLYLWYAETGKVLK